MECLPLFQATSNYSALESGTHHERLDGGGFPSGLKGSDITLETRIITTSDIFTSSSPMSPQRRDFCGPDFFNLKLRMPFFK